MECPDPGDWGDWLVKSEGIGNRGKLDLLSLPVFSWNLETLSSLDSCLSERFGEQQGILVIKRNTTPDYMNFLMLVF